LSKPFSLGSFANEIKEKIDTDEIKNETDREPIIWYHYEMNQNGELRLYYSEDIFELD
jgi:hypothetical protein